MIKLTKSQETRRRRGRHADIPFFIPHTHVTRDIVAFARSLAPKQNKIFNKMVFWFSQYPEVYLTQDTLARAADCSRKHANFFLSKMEEWNIIRIVYRHQTSCVYHLSSYFRSPDVCFKLSKIITSFWTLGLLASCALISHEVTQLNKGYIYISSPCPSVNIVEELSPGDSAQRNTKIETCKEKSFEKESRGENYHKKGEWDTIRDFEKEEKAFMLNVIEAKKACAPKDAPLWPEFPKGDFNQRIKLLERMVRNRVMKSEEKELNFIIF